MRIYENENKKQKVKHRRKETMNQINKKNNGCRKSDVTQRDERWHQSVRGNKQLAFEKKKRNKKIKRQNMPVGKTERLT